MLAETLPLESVTFYGRFRFVFIKLLIPGSTFRLIRMQFAIVIKRARPLIVGRRPGEATLLV